MVNCYVVRKIKQIVMELLQTLGFFGKIYYLSINLNYLF